MDDETNHMRNDWHEMCQSLSKNKSTRKFSSSPKIVNKRIYVTFTVFNKESCHQIYDDFVWNVMQLVCVNVKK